MGQDDIDEERLKVLEYRKEYLKEELLKCDNEIADILQRLTSGL